MSHGVRIFSPAKINLFLEVVCRRPDGYHEIKTLLQAIDWCDELRVARRPGGIRLASNSRELPLDSRNLVYRAAELFLRENRINHGVEISLQKNIPIAAGLGGGSSNAACTLLALDRLFGTRWSLEKLSVLAENLGSDVPFFVRGIPSVGIGRGDELIPIKAYLPFWVVLAGLAGTPRPNKTAEIYDALRLATNCGLTESPKPITITIAAIETKSIKGLSESLFNRLEGVVIDRMPEAREIRQFMQARGAMGALVSGAGPAVFGIVPDKAHGILLKGKISRRFGNGVWTTVAKTLPSNPRMRCF